MTPPVGEKGSAARRGPRVGREAYSLYVERPTEGPDEADVIGNRQGWAVLDGEVAVPCNPQSAIAGLNSLSRVGRVE